MKNLMPVLMIALLAAPAFAKKKDKKVVPVPALSSAKVLAIRCDTSANYIIDPDACADIVSGIRESNLGYKITICNTSINTATEKRETECTPDISIDLFLDVSEIYAGGDASILGILSSVKDEKTIARFPIYHRHSLLDDDDGSLNIDDLTAPFVSSFVSSLIQHGAPTRMSK
ncbi:MAG TPA: hypothetical protein VMV59_00350 [Candidatus Dormibacteraeota bacterium]|nr:hypothetical protein [Candidatus Dormibacteraeota bacterium]